MRYESKQNGRSVLPIQTMEDIRRIKALLNGKPRDLLLFNLAIDTGLKMRDILTLTVEDLIGLKPGDPLSVERPAGRYTEPIPLTWEISRTFQRYYATGRLQPEDYLFKSRKGSRPVNLSSVSNMIQGWFKAIGIEGLHGAKSLRKTYLHLQNNDDSGPLPSNSESDPVETLKPIRTPVLRDRVYKQLLHAIVTSQIPPGTRLLPADISQRFGVSQQTVREALRYLEAAFVVKAVKRKGYSVNKLTKQDLNEILSIRLNLECPAAALACKSVSTSTLTRLTSLHNAHRIETDVENIIRLNRDFHFTIYRAAGMPILMQIIDGLWQRVLPYFHIFLSIMTPEPGDREKIERIHAGA
ncbi:MAG: FCD domain-containing protein [Deltaproteobacteria bacterium]|nr:FCD domain-containing protein [Deltaproteobacteria bacterium]